MGRTSGVTAGGIVLRRDAPLFAVVRLRKRNEWMLPKGRLDDGETPRQAAEREATEETGHRVEVHEFLGILAYEAGSGSKAVHFWRMEADREPSRDLATDVKAVAWLPLSDAVKRLSRDHEKAFLADVGPRALAASGGADVAEPSLLPRDGLDERIVTRRRRTIWQRAWRWLRRRLR